MKTLPDACFVAATATIALLSLHHPPAVEPSVVRITTATPQHNVVKGNMAAHEITLASLLGEMVDRDALARWPEPEYSGQGVHQL